jgi:cellulose synthase/poly-beta-1,6-N-acetylglucosamine synthase-like glycosyltransferase
VSRPSAQHRLRRRHVLSRLVTSMFFTFEGGLALSSGYLLLLLFAARDATRRPATAPAGHSEARLRFVVLIPAHDEQAGIQATLVSLASCHYPVDRRRTIVIADNCTDRTAHCVRRAGVEVWERDDQTKRGKGFALSWALQRLQTGGEDFDVVVILDADCLVSPNILSAMEAYVRRGADAVQVSNAVGNPDASHASALRFAAFALMNTVRPLGKQQLGLSCGLFGTGMAFTRELLRREPWNAAGLAEDGEYHMRLVQAGERAQFVPNAWVSSAMPTSFAGSSSQQARWEYGRLQIARRWSPKLVATGFAKRDIVRVHAGLECLIPPQSLIAVGSLGSTLAGLLLGSRRLVRLSVVTLVAQLGFVLAGLRLLRVPASVYRALLVAPALIAGKVVLYGRLLAGRSPTTWVRTKREA